MTEEPRQQSLYRKVKEMLVEHHRGHSGGHLGVNKTLQTIRQWYLWLHPRTNIKRWCQQWHICSKLRSQDQKPGPNEQSQWWDTIHEDCKGHHRTLPRGQDRKLIPPDCHKPLYEMAGGICHHKPRGINCARWPCLQQLLLLQGSECAVQRTKAGTSFKSSFKQQASECPQEKARNISSLCTCSQIARWNDVWR
jgi:hypothetical protein